MYTSSFIFIGIISNIILGIKSSEGEGLFISEEKTLNKRQAMCPPGCNQACAPACNPDCCTSAKSVSAAFLQAAASALCPPSCAPVPAGSQYYYSGYGSMCPPGCGPVAPPPPPPPSTMGIDTPSPVAAIQAANVAAKALQGLLNTAYAGICPPICQSQCQGCSPACCASLLAKCAQNSGMAGCH